MTEVRQAGPGDDAISLSRRAFGADIVIARGTVFDLNDYPALVAIENGVVVGALHYLIDDDGLEIVAIAADPRGRGTGRALIAAAAALAPRLRLVTTNDNLPAIGLYQSMGFRMVRIRQDAVARAREIKPEIPLIGYRGIPLRDEIDMVRESG